MADLKELSRQAIALYNAHDLDGFVARHRRDAELVAPGAPQPEAPRLSRKCGSGNSPVFPTGR
jgi:hypothetical protein